MTSRRASARRVKIHYNYTVDEAAEVTGKHPHTIRRWIDSKALPALTERRPHLIIGSVLHAYLAAPKPGSARLKPGELYCVKCRLPKRPALDMADYVPINDQTGNLKGFLPDLRNPHAPAGINVETAWNCRRFGRHTSGGAATPKGACLPLHKC